MFKTLTSVNVKFRMVRESLRSRAAVVDSHDPEKSVLLGCMFIMSTIVWNCEKSSAVVKTVVNV